MNLKVSCIILVVTLGLRFQTNCKVVSDGSMVDDESLAKVQNPKTVSEIGKSRTTEFVPPELGSGRLPLALRPFHYTLMLQPFINGNRSISGHVKIDFQVLHETDKIILNMVDIISLNDTCEVVVIGENQTNKLEIISQTYAAEDQFYTVLLKRPLLMAMNYSVSLSYEGYLNDKLVGFYLSTYKDAEGKEHKLASTQFSPTDARRAFPCFDEPGFKATFDVTLLRQRNMTALSNMPKRLTKPMANDDSWLLDKFEVTPRMSTYLMAFMISDFVSVSSDRLNSTQFKVWVRKDAINQTDYSLNVGPQLLNNLEEYFGISFPLPKLDLAAIPNFKFSGMENWGLIMFRESAILYDPEVSSVESKRRLMQVLAHEIAHMWFGNLVTPMWWSELWLKEGFANYMGYKAVDAIEPEWKMLDYLAYSTYQEAFNLDGLRSSHPIQVQVDRADRISEIFDDISYSKGASIIRMMEHFLTERVFRRGLTNYLNNLKYSNAVQDDLWNYLTASWSEADSYNWNITVKEVMDTWTVQEGFPVITVAKSDLSISVTQTRFLLEGKIDLPPDRQELNKEGWWIPISFTSSSSLDFEATHPKLWMSPGNKTATIPNTFKPGEWVIFNVQRTGFYRVNYDKDLWSLLTEQLLSNFSAVHHLNRLQLIDDSMNLARAGLLDYSVPFSLMNYIKDETDLAIWKTFSSDLYYIYQMFLSTEKIALLQNYLSTLIVPLFDRVGFSDEIKDDYESQSLRSLAVQWACRVKHEPCLRKAKSLFRSWLEGLSGNESSTRVSSSVKRTVFCYGIKYSSEEEWNKTFEAYLKSNVQSEKADILSALGCSQSPSTLQRYLEMSLNDSSGILKQDVSYVFSSVSSTINGRDLAWRILQQNWNFVVEYFGPGSNALWRLLDTATEDFNTQQLLEELREFAQENSKSIGSALRTLRNSLESSQLNIVWMNNGFPQIASVLERFS